MNLSRRQFLHTTAVFAAGSAVGWTAPTLDEFPPAQTFDGGPRERGLAYGRAFKDGIGEFLGREIYGAFAGKQTKEGILRYAAACSKEIAGFSPEIHAELEGTAEGAGITLEEAVAITLHEELYHRGVLPGPGHCTVVAAAPPMTNDGHAYVGQTWDWMQSVYGTSRMLRWRRSEGPEVLAYGFPGLPVGAGLNSAGLALCWTSADLGKHDTKGPRVGIPSYVLLTHFLHQKTLDDVAAEAKRAKHAGWFTFVMADGAGRLLNIEGSPDEVAIEWGKGRMVRAGYASEQMQRRKQGANTNKGHFVAANRWLDDAAGKANSGELRTFFGATDNGICAGKGTIDVMLFDCTDRKAHLSRGPSHKLAWKSYGFE